MSRLGNISGAIYRLKRMYGQQIEFVRLISIAVNTATGVQNVTRNSWTLQRAVVLPKVLERSFKYDLSFIAANKNFTYGALYDAGTREILIDKKDIGINFVPTMNDYLVWNQGHYKISEAQDYEGTNALYIKAVNVVGNSSDDIRLRSVTSALMPTQSTNSEIE